MISKAQKPNHLMLFDLEVGGHHVAYIRHLLHYRPNKPESTRRNDFFRFLANAQRNVLGKKTGQNRADSGQTFVQGQNRADFSAFFTEYGFVANYLRDS